MFNEKVIQALLKLGIAGIFAGVLLGFVIGEVRADQQKNREEHQEIRERMTGIENVMGQFLMSQERLVYLQRRQCINTARTKGDMEACAKDKE